MAAAGPAAAGPWAQPVGDVFLSFTITAEDDRETIALGVIDPSRTLGLYAETGIAPRLTFGLDLLAGEDERQAVGFVRYTITAPERTWQFAVDAGFGGRWPEGQPESRLVRFGASIGRGFGEGHGNRWWFPLDHGGGWTTLDAYALYDIDTEDLIWQAEATLGLTLSERSRVMLQIKAEEWPDSDLAVSVAPSFVWRVWEDTSLQIGSRVGVRGHSRVNLTLSLWQEF